MNIDVKGVIVDNDDKWIYDWFGLGAVCPGDIHKAISAANGERLDVYVNSPGGDIGAGTEIYGALESYPGEVFTHGVGNICSAATVIMCAGKSDIVCTSLFMIHNVSGGASGDYNEMDKASEVLKKANKAICAAYVAKTGRSENELLAKMNAETWLTAQEAVDLGFIDKIAESRNTNIRLAASYANGLLPAEVLEKMRNRVNYPLGNKADFFTSQAKLKYLKLGGKI